jgi:molybdate transport repressor ModE-like protein
MRIEFEPGWKLRSAPVAPLLVPLLVAIQRFGSLAAAARSVGYSYRHVWSVLGDWNQRMGQPLVELERGRGARLTPLALKLLELEERARTRLAPQLAELAQEFERELYGEAIARAPQLTICASHDLALERLPELTEGALQLGLRFHGSVESLETLARGDCDLAGFHVAEQWQTPEILQLLDPSVHKLIGLAVREQGLIVARGNPKGIQGLHDLIQPGLRFVNRQRGSGTRLVFDQLLTRAGIASGELSGYSREAFTHTAVAAAVADGSADAGFGIRAAAAHLELGFIPLVSERYVLACTSNRLESSEVKKFLAFLRGKPFKAVLASLPGYDNAITGRVMGIAEGLDGPRPARVAALG